MFVLKVLWIVFGPNTEDVTEGWRKLHNEELRYLYTSKYTGISLNEEIELPRR
jgi:hypothetical protein